MKVEIQETLKNGHRELYLKLHTVSFSLDMLAREWAPNSLPRTLVSFNISRALGSRVEILQRTFAGMNSAEITLGKKTLGPKAHNGLW